MTHVQIKRDAPVPAPCDCSDGPCGWAHWAQSHVNDEYFIDGVAVTREDAESAHAAGASCELSIREGAAL